MTINVVEKIDDLVKIRRALISVSDKTDLDFFVRGIYSVNPNLVIYSTGGTFSRLKEIISPIVGAESIGQLLRQVSDYTGQKELQGGLVKTLDWKIYLGLLTETYNKAHQADMAAAGAVPIDLLVNNLYPFNKTVAQPDVTFEKARGNIDIGGPAMLRAAAKNFHRVMVATEPRQYQAIIDELRANKGCSTLKTRYRLFRQAFDNTKGYDTGIVDYGLRVDYDQVIKCYNIQNPSQKKGGNTDD